MTNFDYKKFLEDKHAKYNTPQEIIKRVVKKSTGHKAAIIKKLLKGEANEVYDIMLNTADEVILRISRSEINPFIPEQWAMEKCKKLGVPVADMLFIDQEEVKNQKIFFCVLSKIEGAPLREIGKDDNQKFMREILVQAGDILSKIHTIKTDGFGHIKTGTGKGQQPTYHDYIQHKFGSSDEYVKAAYKNDLDPQKIIKAINIIFQNETLFKDQDSILAHGDFGTRHIMVKENKITGILDFGNMRGSFPVHDFAWWDTLDNTPHLLDWIKEGYSNKSVFQDDYEIKFYTIKLLIGLELLWWNNLEGQMEGVEKAKISITSSIDFFI